MDELCGVGAVMPYSGSGVPVIALSIVSCSVFSREYFRTKLEQCVCAHMDVCCLYAITVGGDRIGITCYCVRSAVYCIAQVRMIVVFCIVWLWGLCNTAICVRIHPCS